MIDEIEPHIYKKYEVLERKGKGAYGIVWKAIERKTKKVVALKKVFDAFHNDTDAQRTFREIMLLQELNGHENIIKLLNVIKAENNKDIYLVFDYMEIDLHHVNRSNILQDIHKVYIVYQILKCLKYLHSAEIVHRDLKPANILIDAECNVKVADFGLARSIQAFDDESAPVMTDYVATRWYRAPEIVLGSCHYSKAVDMWSVGCILGELIVGKAIFPGKSTINQVELIIQLLGKPTPRELDAINAATDFSIIESMSAKKKYSFSQFFKGASKEALDFLRRTLVFDPTKRLSAEQALKHPFVRQFHNPEEEIVCDKIIRLPISDAKKLSLKEYRDALYSDILRKKKEQRKKWKMKYLQQLGISTAANPNDIKKTLMAKDKKREGDRRAKRDRGEFGNARGYGGSKQSSGYTNPAEYNQKAAYKASSKNYQKSSGDGDDKYGDYGNSYKYYKPSGGSKKGGYKKR
jgi:mitogen-activated protein kinase 15